MRFTALTTAVAIALASTLSLAHAQSAPAAGGKYTAEATQLGTLLGDPAAKAVLAKYIPDAVNNDGIQQAAGMTLKDLQQYIPTLTPQVMASIDTDLAKLPAKK